MQKFVVELGNSAAAVAAASLAYYRFEHSDHHGSDLLGRTLGSVVQCVKNFSRAPKFCHWVFFFSALRFPCKLPSVISEEAERQALNDEGLMRLGQPINNVHGTI